MVSIGGVAASSHSVTTDSNKGARFQPSSVSEQVDRIRTEIQRHDSSFETKLRVPGMTLARTIKTR
jgi:hypothetical protein